MGRDTDEEDDFISIPGAEEEEIEEAASEEEDPVQRLILDKASKRDGATDRAAQGDGVMDGPSASLHGEEDAGQGEEADEEEEDDEEEPVVNLEGDAPIAKKRKKKKKKKKKAKSEGKDVAAVSCIHARFVVSKQSLSPRLIPPGCVNHRPHQLLCPSLSPSP